MGNTIPWAMASIQLSGSPLPEYWRALASQHSGRGTGGCLIKTWEKPHPTGHVRCSFCCAKPIVKRDFTSQEQGLSCVSATFARNRLFKIDLKFLSGQAGGEGISREGVNVKRRLVDPMPCPRSAAGDGGNDTCVDKNACWKTILRLLCGIIF